MATNQAEAVKHFLTRDLKGRQSLRIPEGRYKAWVPRCIYEIACADVCLPFLKLLSFPIGGNALGQLVAMETFNIVGNYLTKLPDSFGKCQNLLKLNLSYNHFERIPSAVFFLSNLIELDMSENELIELCPQIANLKKLKILNLSGNLLSELPEELCHCEKLENLELSRKFYPKGGFEKLPMAVCYLKELVSLDVSWHQIACITDDVGNMTKLQTLRIRGNFLKHVSSKISQCKQLKHLDLTGAMKLNSYIPPELFTLPELTVLDLTNNYFTEISPNIIGLKKLKILIMKRNALLRVPNVIFQMECLETLDFSENYLEEIPSCVNQLSTLKHLYLGFNKIQSLPDEICECRSLIELQMHNNQLESLPSDIYKLDQLEELLLDRNQLKTLPLMLDRMEKLRTTERLGLYENQLVKPPQAVCDQGVSSLYKYLKDLRISEATHRKKLILIGASKAGKSSLRNVLLLGKSKLTAENERTWVLEQHVWEPEPAIRVQILDFGGHHIYTAAHHMFLAPEALHVLVFDLSEYAPNKYDELVGDWLDSIMDRAAGATIMLVGTHSDLCTESDIKSHVDHILSKMHVEENVKIKDLQNVLSYEQKKLTDGFKVSGQKFPDLVDQRLQERVNKLQKLHMTRVKLPEKIYVVSCAETLSGIDDFYKALTTSLMSHDDQALPESWLRFLTEIQLQQDKVISWARALDIFKSVMGKLNQSMYKMQGSADQSLDTVLRYLHTTGEIIWFHENSVLRKIIFHHPETLVDMLRVIFRHDFKEVVNFEESDGQLTGLTKVQFELLKTEFLQQGLMTAELLSYCLNHFHISTQSQDIFMDLMLKFDLCYEVENTMSAPGTMGSKRILRFPWFLTPTPIEDLEIKWPAEVPENTIELRYQLKFLKKGLPNFFEKLSARIQSNVTSREDWKDGVLAMRNHTNLLLTRQKVSGLNCITLAVRGADLQELWKLILVTRADVMSLLQEWPFVMVDNYMVCSHCLVSKITEPYSWRAEVLDVKLPRKIYEIKCPKTNTLIPACIVHPLDPDFTADDIEIHNEKLKDFLKNVATCDTVDGAGFLSDLSIDRLARKLGEEWQSVVLELGLKNSFLQQTEIDHRYSVHMQIKFSLLEWRNQSKLSYQDKFKQLLDALHIANREDLVEELTIQYNPSCGNGDVNRGLIFGTARTSTTMSHFQNWDRTFAVVPELFFQLYIVHLLINALAFVPISEVVNVFEELQEEMSEESLPVLDYFEDAYIGREDEIAQIPYFLMSIHNRTINEFP